MWVLTHDTYEASRPTYPVVRHEFYGITKAEAIAIYQAHRKADKFICSCDDLQRYGKVSCYTEVVSVRQIDI